MAEAKTAALSGDKLIGNSEDFEKFTFSPVELAKQKSSPFKHKSWSSSAGKIINVVSSYCTMG